MVDRELVTLTDIGKTYHTTDLETRALMAITLSIVQGDYVSIEGPSGCGKSTLLAIIGLLDTPTNGDYKLKNISVSTLSAEERCRIRNIELGFIFQNFNLIGDLTIFQNVELPLVYRGLSRFERRRRVSETLDRVGMSHRAAHFPAQLSGGQQQRVAVARALAGEPALLLADEPTGNLDSINGESVMGLLQELHSTGSTIVMVTHDHRFAACASRTIRLLDGRISADA
jgi:putative ABC transport system ATP-binding protein